jgi:MAP3K TRAFs-binding domain
MKPLCFVLMPFGVKPAGSLQSVDFDAIYRELIVPAIEEAGFEPIRADGEQVGGIIHKPMFERLRLCEFAVADLTSSNPNVFYELGIRHAVRPWATLPVFALGQPLAFDVALARAIPYRLTPAGRPDDAEAFVTALAAALTAAREPTYDSPVYQLLSDWPELSHTKTDAFRDHAVYSESLKHQLAGALRLDSAAQAAEIDRIVETLGNLDDVEAGVLVDVVLSYRAGSNWGRVVEFVERLPKTLRRQVLIREQYGLALNRVGRSDEAEAVLKELIEEHGPSPETCGILGRVYKDRYEKAVKVGSVATAALLDQAIEMYRKGFEADWRDSYPGVNLVRLMALRNPTDPELTRLVPVVAYSTNRKVARDAGDYWDHVTLMELAVLMNDESAARTALGSALATKHDRFMTGTTGDTLDSAIKNGGPPWLSDLRKALTTNA